MEYIRMNMNKSRSENTKSRSRTNEQEKVNGFIVVDSINEPLLLNHIRSFDHLRDIRISREVEQHAKCHDVKTSKCQLSNNGFREAD